MASSVAQRKIKMVSYAKYGYMFILPFFVIYAIFSLYPLIYTFIISTQRAVGTGDAVTEFVGLQNFQHLLFGGDNISAQSLKKFFVQSLGNTVVLWFVNFIPQIALSLAFAVWFTDSRLKVKGSGIFKVLMYLPNIITASSVAVLFLSLLGETPEAPVNSILLNLGLITDPVEFLSDPVLKRTSISLIQCWMWFGNTMILLISGIMSISPSLFEAADIDGANGRQVFTKITVPMLRPILLYVLLTSMIGGLQMFDIPLLFNLGAVADNDTKTVAIFIYERYSGSMKNYGYSAAASIILFAITSVFGAILFYVNRDKDELAYKKQLKQYKKLQKTKKSQGYGGLM